MRLVAVMSFTSLVASSRFGSDRLSNNYNYFHWGLDSNKKICIGYRLEYSVTSSSATATGIKYTFDIQDGAQTVTKEDGTVVLSKSVSLGNPPSSNGILLFALRARRGPMDKL